MKHEELPVGTVVCGCKLSYICHLMKFLYVISMHLNSQKTSRPRAVWGGWFSLKSG